MDLEMKLNRLKKDPESIAMTLIGQTLNGVVLAQVGGGIPKIEEAFLEPEYGVVHEEDEEYICLLKEEIVKQMKIIEELLPIHGLEKKHIWSLPRLRFLCKLYSGEHMADEMKRMQEVLADHFKKTNMRVQQQYRQEYELFDENAGFKVGKHL